MYMHDYTEMKEAGVAELLASPEWTNREGRIVEKMAVFSCNCSHRLTNPEYCIVLDKM